MIELIIKIKVINQEENKSKENDTDKFINQEENKSKEI
jgi:hypothetical protein